MTGDATERAWRAQLEALAVAWSDEEQRRSDAAKARYNDADRRTREMVRATHRRAEELFSEALTRTLELQTRKEEELIRQWDKRCDQAAAQDMRDRAAILAEEIVGRGGPHD